MSNEDVDSFFDNTGSSGPLPSAKLSNIGDFVHGKVVDQFKVEKKKFASDEIEKDKKTGEPIKQLVVVLETESRNWDKVAKVPLSDPKDKRSDPLPGEDDEGRRAVYVAPFTNIHAALGEAIVKGTGKKGGLQIGATLGVKITDLEPTDKGNPKKVHAAVYEPPKETANEDFFSGGEKPGSSEDPWAGSKASESSADPNPQSAPPF